MIPFHPHAFPPRRLHKKRVSRPLRTANGLLQEFNSFLTRSPSPQDLFFQLVNIESISSVESQRVKTTLVDFLRFLEKKEQLKNAKLHLIFDYRKALLWACKQIQKTPLSKEFLCAIHKKAKRNSASKTELGKYRNRQNWIGPRGCKMEEAYFYPPTATKVEELMRELLQYAKKNEKEPLIQLALFFAQFLIIHPFMDGNGRVARILVPLFLYQKKATPLPFLFISRYFLKHRLQYFYKLFKTTEENKWESWIAFFLKGMSIEMRKILRVFKRINSLYHEVKEKLPELKQEPLLFLFQNPIFSNASFKKAKGNLHLLNQLKRARLVKEIDGKYCFLHLIKILNHHKKQ